MEPPGEEALTVVEQLVNQPYYTRCCHHQLLTTARSGDIVTVRCSKCGRITSGTDGATSDDDLVVWHLLRRRGV